MRCLDGVVDRFQRLIELGGIAADLDRYALDSAGYMLSLLPLRNSPGVSGHKKRADYSTQYCQVINSLMYISELLPVRILFSESIILPDFLKHLLRRFCSSLEHIVIALLDFSVKLLFGKIAGNNDSC